jgi:hypothetical protein
VDDEQGPWWTRPPEPGPQARARQGGDDEYPPTDSQAPSDPYAAVDPYAPADPNAPVGQYAPTNPYAPADPAPKAEPGRPSFRRVAVPQKPASPPPADQTQTLPAAVEDDIFATFSGPIPLVGAPSPDSTKAASYPSSYPLPNLDGGPEDPLNHWRDDRPRRLPPLKLPEGRILLLGVAGGLVLVLIVLVALITGGGSGAPPKKPPRTAVAAKSTVNTTTEMPGRNPAGLKKLGDAEATALLRKAGEGPSGSIVEAWSWSDKNGHNLVVTSTEASKTGKQTLRVIHVAGLDGPSPKTLRIMRDPNLPTSCRSTGTAGFTKNALIVRDLNSDGIAEVMAGWSSRCGGKGTDSEVKLALITNGDKYILRGKGVIGKQGSGDLTPAPRSAKWPKSFFKTLSNLFAQLYY